MKKFLTMVLAMGMLVLSGCMSTGTPSSEPNEPNSGDSSEETKEQVLFEDDSAKVTFIEIFEMPELVGSCYVRLKVENKSDKTVRVSLKDSYVNDTAQMMGTGVPVILAPGKNSQQPFFFGYSNLGISSKDEIEKIEFKVWLMDDETYDTVVETDSLVVDFTK